MPVPAILPLLALGVGFIALLSKSGAGASAPSSTGTNAMSPADLVKLAAWSKANLTPDQDQLITLMLRASQASKGRIEIGDVCSALAAQLSAAQMVDVVTLLPALAECNAPSSSAPPAPMPSPDDMPSLPDAQPGMPAPPPPDAGGGSDGGGGGAQPLPTPEPQPTPMPAVVNTPAWSAANAMRVYLESTGHFGSKAKPDATIKLQQAGMGGGLKADGIVGPKTTARAKQLGVILPKPPKPGAKPTTSSAQQKAAQELKTYLASTKDFGTKAKPSATVKYYQKLMAGGLAQDGIVGPKTIARAKALGVVLPTSSNQPAVSTTAPASTSSATSAASKAAAALREYLIATGDFGSKAHPSAKVKSYQGPLGVTADGIVGPKTRDAAAKYGSILPVAGSAGPSSATATQADLLKRPPSIVLATRAASAPSSGGAISGASGDLVPALSEQAIAPLVAQFKPWAAQYLTPALEAQLYAKLQARVKPKGASLKLPLDYEALASVLSPGDACATLSSSIPASAWAALKKIPTMTSRVALACENRLVIPDGFPKATWNAASAAQQKQIVMNFVPGVQIVTPQKPAASTAPAQSASAQQQAAQKLGTYLASSQDFGSKAKPSATVKTYQSQMGGLVADGIVGPKTNARAAALGVSLPAPHAATQVDGRTAAASLGRYLASSKDFGSKTKPSATVKLYQSQMGGITADGIVGPNTRLRAQQLGTTLPASATPAAPAAAKPASAAPAGYNAAEAKRLSRIVVQDIQQHGATYNKGLLKSFQKAAGLVADGYYGGRSVGALKYFGSTRAPAALFNPKAEVPYAPPA